MRQGIDHVLKISFELGTSRHCWETNCGCGKILMKALFVKEVHGVKPLCQICHPSECWLVQNCVSPEAS